MKISFIVYILILLSVPAFAQDTVEPTRIEINSETNEIYFYIDGKLGAILSADGLHVRNNIEYGGVLTDIGSAGFDNKVREPAKEEGADDAP